MANQANRHEARNNIVIAAMALQGEPGLTYDQQLERLDAATEALKAAQTAVIMARLTVEDRKAKAAVAEALANVAALAEADANALAAYEAETV